MAKEDLIPITERTKEEAKEISEKGGIKSGQVRRAKRDAKKIISLLLESKAPDKLAGSLKSLFPDVDPQTIEECLNLAMIKTAMKGDVRAYNALLDRVDGKPLQKQDVTTDGESFNGITINFKNGD